MATACEGQSIFFSLSSDGGTEVQEVILNIGQDLRREDKEGLKYLTAVCFEEQELESLNGFRDCLCDILHKYKLTLAFLAKVLATIGRQDLVRKYLLHPDLRSKSGEECFQMFKEHLSDDKTLLSDDKLDPVNMFFRFTLYRITQSFTEEEEKQFKQFISTKYSDDIHIDPSTTLRLEEVFNILERQELLTPANNEIMDTFLGTGSFSDEFFEGEVRAHLDNFRVKFNEYSTVADGVSHLNIHDGYTTPPIESYTMSSTIRGCCAILVQTECRTGAREECVKLKQTFEALRYQVELHIDYTSQQTVELMGVYAGMDHSEFDSFVCFILGHGQMHNSKDYLYCSDHRMVNVDELLNAMNSQTLKNKPKLFFINICRYDPYDDESQSDGIGRPSAGCLDAATASMDSTTSFYSNIEGDVLKAYSTASGTKSNRSKREGAWYITELCSVLTEHTNTLPLLAMLTLVHQRICKRRNPGLTLKTSQTPQCCNQLKKLLYFRDANV